MAVGVCRRLSARTSTPIPDPTATPAPEPTATIVPDPTATAAPEPTATPAPVESELARDAAIASILEVVDGSEADAACIADAVQSQTGEYAVIDDDIGLDNDEAFTAFVAGTVLCATKSAMSEGFVLLGYTESEVSCIFDSADSMFDLSQDALSDAETDAEELQMAADANQCAAPVGPKTNSAAPGTESDLDETWDACSNEDGAACFALFEAGEIDGDYQIYGATCGGRSVWPIDCGLLFDGDRVEPEDNFDFASLLGNDLDDAKPTPLEDASVPGPESAPPGQDKELDLLWEQCGDGNGEACDMLYFESDIDTVYEQFGDSCGGRIVPRGRLCADENL